MNPSQVLKQNRSLYGLAAATWFKMFLSFFKNMGFVACVTDPCVFVRHNGHLLWIYVTLYVDDMMIGGTSDMLIDKVADEFSSHFKLKTLGNVRFILGIEVEYAHQTKKLKISQAACINRMIVKFNQVGAKAVHNPSVMVKSCSSARKES
uniref:Reverse transcriptase Ty1/copia-type domain-containing protein n=1 Tax=Peronospora matthiolae TaxID=2874970 RepID=A0AAV1V2H8_9STRA